MSNLFSSIISKLNEKKHQFQKHEQATNHRVAHILTDDAPFSIKEAYKTARTNIIFALAGQENCKKVVLTSAEPGEGKTTTVLNLSITFAQTGSKVLVIDGDLRKPRIHRYLHFDKKNGLSDLLIGTTTLDKAIRHHDNLNIDFIPAGQIPPNPVELLSSEKMDILLKTLEGKYDYIFIDSPPVTVVSDAASMANFIDGYILVIRHNYTIHELLEKARASLLFAEGKVLGYVMNDIKPLGGIAYNQYGAYSSKYYSYKGRYGYGYRYGYGSRGYNYRYTYHDVKFDDPEISEEEERKGLKKKFPEENKQTK